ncbi:MAG: SDR family oxidoreductase [Deltaproteobacteria bacterium]|nr:SDR family oxidoreductase [Deltaproteobacteria bacterium]
MPGRVVVTGISGRLGRLVAQRLHREPGVRVMGIDRRAFYGKPKDVEHLRVDLRSKRAREAFRGGDVRALVHMGVLHDPRVSQAEHYTWNVQGTQRLLEYCEKYDVRKVVVLSSANVYGPSPTNPQFLTEDAPLMAGQRFPEMRDLVAVDMLACSHFWKNQQAETVVLRPVHILGSVTNGASDYLRFRVAPTLLGFDPMVQLIHELDVVEAVALALRPGVRGIFNLTGPGEVPLSVILRELGRPTIPIPHFLAEPLLSRLWRWRLTSFPVPEIDYARYVCMVDGTRAHEQLGFRPRYNLRETIRAVLREQMPPPRDRKADR